MTGLAQRIAAELGTDLVDVQGAIELAARGHLAAAHDLSDALYDHARAGSEAAADLSDRLWQWLEQTAYQYGVDLGSYDRADQVENVDGSSVQPLPLDVPADAVVMVVPSVQESAARVVADRLRHLLARGE